ncbi:MAG: Arc family DNA-binding protein [Oscillospiraceae bacterium]|nr:Arc family DNA-binding protein [Oscillospiraceae bacterium]
MPATKVQVGARFEPEMLVKITYIAKRNRRSLNAQIEFLVQECIEKYELEVEKIQVSADDMYKR